MERIPCIIHYCWFGKKEKPKIVLKCINSWKKFMPNMQILEWNESNYDVHKIDFIREAYSCEKWAFVSDYARFDILNQFGGIYFDTDVEMLKPIPDDILKNKAFTGFESTGTVSPGLVFAAVKGFPILLEILDIYNNSHFLINGKENIKTVNNITTELLIKKGLCKNNKFQIIDELAIYPADFFCGFDQDVKELNITPNTVTVHHYAGTWTQPTLKKIVRKWIKRVCGVNNYRRLLAFKRMVTQSKQ